MKKLSLIFLITVFFPVFGFSQVSPEGLEALTITESADGTKTYSLSLKILALMTALTILPSLVLGMTAFTRIIIVMSILRQALGTQQTPPNQILVAISLFLTFFVMAPTFNKIYSDYISSAFPKITPCPHTIKGFLASSINSNASSKF